MTYDRLRLVSFLYPHSLSSTTFVTPAPRIVNSQQMFRPYSITVWYSFIIALFICFIFDRIQRKFNRTESNLFWICFVQLCRQNYLQKSINHFHQSLWIIFWTFGMFIFTTGYASCLYSLIAIPSYSQTINTIEELFSAVRSGQIIASSRNSSVYINIFKEWLGDAKTTVDIDRVWNTSTSGYRAMAKVNISRISGTPYAYIDQRETLKFGTIQIGEKFFYIPPNNIFATLFTDLVAIPVRSDFPYYSQFNNPPFTMFLSSSLKLTRGSEAHFIETLSSYFNFSFRLVNCKLSWGKKYPNGSWDGMIGLLTDKKIDMGLGGTLVDYDRWKAVSFLYPQTATSITFVTAAPSLTLSSHNLIFRPFPLFVWLSFLITLFVCYIFDHIQRKYNQNKINIFWISLVQLFHQDSFRRMTFPRHISIYIILWNFASFILTIAYAGCLYSMIAAPSYSKTIDTVNQLYTEIKSGHIIITSFNSSQYANFYKDWLGDVSIDYWKPIHFTFDGFQMVNNSAHTGLPHVHIGLRETLQFGVADFGEKFLYLPQQPESSLFTEIISIPVRPGFLYYDMFNRAIGLEIQPMKLMISGKPFHIHPRQSK
ncbi:uncharacterized protein LOC124495716 isoform X2 [Dermatophagoides farinae]|uniref:uncharacterized protein LOC124495716 isoform X2 n=1 Tax=Dermatophagoides farinae TaxID=6954 RepID=UPI003F63D09D